MFFRTCPLCGSNLDPGERCDCNEKGDDLLSQERPQIQKFDSSLSISAKNVKARRYANVE